jgi:rhodanese-related sulfurtransferase
LTVVDISVGKIIFLSIGENCLAFSCACRILGLMGSGCLKMSVSNPKIIVGLLIIIGGALPICAFIFAMRGVHEISSAEAIERLADSPEAVALIDLRSSSSFEALHLRNAVSIPYAEGKIFSAARAGKIFSAARAMNKSLLFCCDSGIHAADVARSHARLGGSEPTVVRGGFAAFLTPDARPLDEEELATLLDGTGELPYRKISLLEQWTLFLTGFVVKPAYMLLAFLIVLKLRFAHAADLLSLRWGMILFLFGEAACAVNYLIYRDESRLMEFLHSYGMVVAFGFIVFSFFEGLDQRVFFFSDSDKRCAGTSLCSPCSKHTDAVCGLMQIFKYLTPMMLVLCLLPLCVQPEMVSYNTKVLLTPFNATHPLLFQFNEMRVFPMMALLMYPMAWFFLLRAKSNEVLWPKIFFSAGTGMLVFSLFRSALFGMFRQRIAWFHAWEEITEMLLLCGIVAILYVFRGTLLKTDS